MIASLIACAKSYVEGYEAMNTKWIRNIGLGAVASLACLGGANSGRADEHHHGHYHHCAPTYGYSNYGYRPVVTVPYYVNNYGVGGYTNYSGYSSGYGNYNNFGGGYGVGAYPTYGSYGGGAFPVGGSYGGGAFPVGGSYGGGAFPRSGSYGGGGFSLHIGR